MALLLAITCVLSVRMGHASSFKTSTFQKLFNDIRNFLIQWVLTLVISLWRFGSPLGLQFPKWEFIWGCGGSFPHTLLHSGSMKCDSRAHSWPTPLQALALVSSPRLRFQHIPFCNKTHTHKTSKLEKMKENKNFNFLGTFKN